MDADGQGHMECVHISNHSSDAYQILYLTDKTEPDTKADIQDLSRVDAWTSIHPHVPQLAETQGNNYPRTVRILTHSGPQVAAIVQWTPTARMTITPCRALSLVTLLSSSIVQYSFQLDVSSTMSGIRSSGALSNPPIRGLVYFQQPEVSNSRRNTVTGMERKLLSVAQTQILQYTLLIHPLPNVFALTSEGHSIWSHVQDEIIYARNIELAPKSIKVVSLMSLDKRKSTNYQRYVENTLLYRPSLCII